MVAGADGRERVGVETHANVTSSSLVFAIDHYAGDLAYDPGTYHKLSHMPLAQKLVVATVCVICGQVGGLLTNNIVLHRSVSVGGATGRKWRQHRPSADRGRLGGGALGRLVRAGGYRGLPHRHPPPTPKAPKQLSGTRQLRRGR